MSRRPAGRSRLLALLAVFAVIAGAAGVLAYNIIGGSDPTTADRPPSTPDPAVGSGTPRVPASDFRLLYRTFGPDEDTIYVAPADRPSDREAVATVRHAEGCGAGASLSPDGGRVALIVLPEGEACRTGTHDDSFNAELRILDLSDGSVRTAATGLDVLSPLIWSPDGRTVLARRNSLQDPANFPYDTVEFLRVAADGGAGETLVTGDGRTLVEPVGYSPDGTKLYYATTYGDRTEVSTINVEDGATQTVASLSPQAREYRLAPDGSALLYLVPDPETYLYEVHVYLLESGQEIVPVREGNQPAGIWHPASKAVGTVQIKESGRGFPVVAVGLDGSTSQPVPKPEDGFDAPVSWSPDGTAMVIKHFKETDLRELSRPDFQVATGGARFDIAAGEEVEFIGWLEPR